MQAVYGWVKNIIYFMIFLAVVNNLLADSKYETWMKNVWTRSWDGTRMRWKRMWLPWRLRTALSVSVHRCG